MVLILSNLFSLLLYGGVAAPFVNLALISYLKIGQSRGTMWEKIQATIKIQALKTPMSKSGIKDITHLFYLLSRTQSSTGAYRSEHL